MTAQIMLSQLKDRAAFESEVQRHIARMKAFNFEKGKPRPVAHPLVESCIKRIQAKGKPDDFVSDYEIINDSTEPMAHLTLKEKKHLLDQKLQEAEIDAKEKIYPRRKMRSLQLKHSDILAKKEEDRNEQDNEVLAEIVAMNEKFRAVNVAAARAACEIEDLTEETVKTWQVPEL